MNVASIRASVFAVLVITLGLSCRTHDSPRCRFDATVTPEERAIVTPQLDVWTPYVLPELRLHVVDGDDDTTLITFADDLPEGVDGRECTYEDEDANCARAEWIRIRRGMTRERTEAVARHEAGHALGLHHLKPSQFGIMNPAEHAAEPSTADVALCQGAGSCSVIQVR